MKQNPQDTEPSLMPDASGTSSAGTPDELARLQQRIRELEQRLAEQQSAENERLALLSERIRQELCFMVGIDRALQPADNHTLNDYQQQLLIHVSDTGRRILEVLEQLVETELPIYKPSSAVVAPVSERSR